MVMQRLDPIREFRKMDAALNQARRGFNGGRVQWRDDGDGGFEQRWRIPVDVRHAGDDIVLSAALPGIAPEDISVTIDQGTLTISAESGKAAEGGAENGVESRFIVRERRHGKFHRALQLPKWVDADGVETQYRHGLLTVTLPKTEGVKARRVEVKAG